MANRRPTISDVARRAGVSKGSVSFALNGRDGVSEATRERILSAAGELGWTPSLRARSLSTSRAHAVGMVLARDPALLGADPFFPAFIAGVESALAPVGQALLLQVVPDQADEFEAYRRLADQGRVDGVFIADLRANDPRIELLAELPLAAVTLNRPDVDSPFPAVCEDDRAGIALLVRSLADEGHTRISHVSGPMEYLHARNRRQAWEEALINADLAPGPLAVADFTAAGGRKATEQLLDGPSPPTAIIYANDLMAIAGLSSAQQRGIGVPDQLSITGFGGSELSAHVHPALTTVISDPFGWGQSAASALLGVIDGNQPVTDIALPPVQLVLRASTGPAPSGA
ncbi:MAG TPA: LacI family DNA-binding transcriptional regulator [Jatrophihabitans sp.]|jgi:DNA-binding LacI/PurR family transcriptional regulator